jgi:methyl-accepting chemotaxis protein
MAKKLRLDVEINAVVNASAEQLDKVQQQIRQMHSTMPGVDSNQTKELQSIGDEINKITNNMKSDISKGAT